MSFWNRGWFGVLLPLATCLQRHLERPIPCRARWIIKMPRADRHRGASRIRNRSDCEIRSQVRDRLYPIRLRAHLLRFGGWTPLAPTPTTEPQEVVGALGLLFFVYHLVRTLFLSPSPWKGGRVCHRATRCFACCGRYSIPGPVGSPQKLRYRVCFWCLVRNVCTAYCRSEQNLSAPRL